MRPCGRRVRHSSVPRRCAPWRRATCRSTRTEHAAVTALLAAVAALLAAIAALLAAIAALLATALRTAAAQAA